MYVLTPKTGLVMSIVPTITPSSFCISSEILVVCSGASETVLGASGSLNSVGVLVGCGRESMQSMLRGNFLLRDNFLIGFRGPRPWRACMVAAPIFHQKRPKNQKWKISIITWVSHHQSINNSLLSSHKHFQPSRPKKR